MGIQRRGATQDSWFGHSRDWSLPAVGGCIGQYKRGPSYIGWTGRQPQLNKWRPTTQGDEQSKPSTPTNSG